MRLLEPTAQIWMKIDPYYQRQQCRPMNLVYENIRFMRIFAGVRLGAGVKRHWGLSTTAIFGLFSWLRLRKLQRYGKQYYMTICYPLSTGKWMQNEWPWMTVSGYFMKKCVFGQHFLNQSIWMSEIVQPRRFYGVLCISRSTCTYSYTATAGKQRVSCACMRSWRAVSLR